MFISIGVPMTYFYRRKNDFGVGYIDTYAYFFTYDFFKFFQKFF